MSEGSYEEAISIHTINERLTITCTKDSATIEIEQFDKTNADILMSRKEIVELGRRILTLWQMPIVDDHPDFEDEFPDLTILPNDKEP